MQLTPPIITAIEIEAVRPDDRDSKVTALGDVVWLVRLKADYLPMPTDKGWWIYVGDLRIPQHSSDGGGLYFKVLDERFFEAHQDKAIRVSQDGRVFHDTGLKLPGRMR